MLIKKPAKKTLSSDVVDLILTVNSLKMSIELMKEELSSYRTLLMASNLEVLKQLQDMHNRIGNLKDFVGIDAFYEACRKEKIDGRP